MTDLTRWAPSLVEANEEDDGPLFDGHLTDPAGEWVRWEDAQARIATLERACARMRESLDLKDLSEDAPRAREKIRTLERELAEALREKQRLENAVNESVCDYNGRVAAHTRGLAAARQECNTWMTKNADLNRRIGNLASSHGLPRVQDVARIYALDQAIDAAVKELERYDWERPKLSREAVSGALAILSAAQKAGG